MKELIKERKASGNKAEAESDCLAKIAEMPPSDRRIAQRLHKLIASNAPQLAPKTWYGMPAYARDGIVVCFFQSAAKFKARYATLGFTDKANIDDGEMCHVSTSEVAGSHGLCGSAERSARPRVCWFG